MEITDSFFYFTQFYANTAYFELRACRRLKQNDTSSSCVCVCVDAFQEINVCWVLPSGSTLYKADESTGGGATYETHLFQGVSAWPLRHHGGARKHIQRQCELLRCFYIRPTHTVTKMSQEGQFIIIWRGEERWRRGEATALSARDNKIRLCVIHVWPFCVLLPTRPLHSLMAAVPNLYFSVFSTLVDRRANI